MITKTLRKAFYVSLSGFFLIIGVAGLVLPIINGTLCIILGLIILSFEFESVELFLVKKTKKHEKLHYWYVKLDSFLRKALRR